MSEKIHPILSLMEQDQRYHIEAYDFVREALGYAQEILKMPSQSQADIDSPDDLGEAEHHITGQQLCEAIRRYSIEQFGFLSKTVLNNWGIYNTGDFGEIVYNLIRIKHMKKSPTDRREDFDDAYDFDDAFEPLFELAGTDER